MRLNVLNPLIKCLNLILIYILYACSFLTLVHINLNIVCGRAQAQYNLHFKKVYLTLIKTLIFWKEHGILSVSSFHNAKTGKRSRSVQYFFFESEKQLNRYSRHKQGKMAEFYLIKPVCLSVMFDAELGKKSWFILLVFLNC